MEKGTVMVVDDDRDTRESLRELLVGEGFTVVLAENGRKALHYLTDDGPPPSVILLDLRMPEMTGWELATLLRVYRKLSSVPLVVMSTLPPYAEILKGALAYLEKPIDVPTLFKTIDAVLASGLEPSRS